MSRTIKELSACKSNTFGVFENQSYFIVTINPFLQRMYIEHRTESGKTYHEDLFYSCIDEWNAFRTDSLYDIHFLYDSGLNISIYPVKQNKADYKITLPVAVGIVF